MKILFKTALNPVGCGFNYEYLAPPLCFPLMSGGVFLHGSELAKPALTVLTLVGFDGQVGLHVTVQLPQQAETLPTFLTRVARRQVLTLMAPHSDLSRKYLKKKKKKLYKVFSFLDFQMGVLLVKSGEIL